MSAIARRHESEAVTERNRQFETHCFVPDISRNALHEQKKGRPSPAHRPNYPEQQCYTPLLHSRGPRNTLKGHNFLELLHVKKLLVPRKGLEPSRP